MYTHTHLLLSYYQATNQLFNISLKLPAWLWICGAQFPALLPAPQTPALMQDKKHRFCASEFNQRCVTNVPLRVLLPSLASVVFYALCVPDIGRMLPGLFM